MSSFVSLLAKRGFQHTLMAVKNTEKWVEKCIEYFGDSSKAIQMASEVEAVGENTNKVTPIIISP